MDRIVRAITPLGEDQLLFRSMHGTESLSELFEFEVDLLSTSVSLDMKSVLGKPLTLEVKTAGAPRYLNGQIVRFTFIGKEEGASRYVVYRATVRPWLWYLTRTSDCKIFQNKSVVDILEEVLGEYGFPFEKKLSASYRQWGYCVQYQETDFDFISRLMEHEGIYYYFKHEQGQHTLVLADDMSAHEILPGYAQISYLSTDAKIDPGKEFVDQWQVSEEIRPGAYVVDDFDFKKPRADLKSVRNQPRVGEHGQYEMYEWLGGFSEADQGEHYSRIRLEQAQSQAERDDGHCNVRGMAPGYLFTMQHCPRNEDNRPYLVVSVSYRLREGDYASGSSVSEGEEGGGQYSFDFVVQPASFPFRAPRVTPTPRANGPQTATVVGKAGQELWVDEYGRVKVQFRWDRYGQSDENSSCWVRVSSAWAGSNFGAVNHPRAGQEVVVDFIGGHLDRPIIIGRVYNADQMPPLELPAKATVSGFISRSRDGSLSNANELLFDDEPGSEMFRMHAEKNMEVDVEADSSHSVAGMQTTTIQGADTYTGNTSLTETVNGPHSVTVNGADQSISVSGGNQSISVSGNQDTTVQTDRSVTVTGTQTTSITGAVTETFKAGQTLTIESVGYTEDITGPYMTTLTGDYTSTRTGMCNETVNGTFDRTVTEKVTEEMKGGRELNVTGDELKDVQGRVDESNTGERNLTVTGAMTQTATETMVVGSTGVMTLVSEAEVNVVVGEASGITIDAGSISLAAGGSSIVIDKSGISVNGHRINLN